MSGFWLHEKPLILASQSAARKKLLSHAGFLFEAIPAQVDEHEIKSAHPEMAAADLAILLATQKALKVSAERPEQYVLGSDQTLQCDGKILSKPGSREGLRVQIAFLAGQTHELHSAAALVFDRRVLFTCVTTATITMRTLSTEAADTYVRETPSAVVESVGGYQLEAHGLHLFNKVEGDYWTILGMPMLAICHKMRERGLLAS